MNPGKLYIHSILFFHKTPKKAILRKCTVPIFIKVLFMIKVGRGGAQRAKFAEKVHKPPSWVNVVNFELNGLDDSIWVF